MVANFFFNSNPRPLPGRRASPVDRLAQGRQGLNLGGSTPVGNLETQSTLPISYDSGVNLFSPRRNPFLESGYSLNNQHPYGHNDPRQDFSRLLDHNKSLQFQNYLERCSREEIAIIVYALTQNQYTLVHMAKNQDRYVYIVFETNLIAAFFLNGNISKIYVAV